MKKKLAQATVRLPYKCLRKCVRSVTSSADAYRLPPTRDTKPGNHQGFQEEKSGPEESTHLPRSLLIGLGSVSGSAYLLAIRLAISLIICLISASSSAKPGLSSVTTGVTDNTNSAPVSRGRANVRVYSARTNADGSESWGVDYRDRAGRRIRRVVASSKRDAEQVAAKLSTELWEGTYFPDRWAASKYSFGDLADAWLAHAKRRKTSWTKDRRHLLIAREFFGEDTIADGLRRRDVEAFVDYLLRTYRSPRGKPISADTVNHYLATLRSAFNRAVDEELLQSSPAKKVADLPTNNQRERIVTQTELRLLLGLASPEMKLGILIAYDTAMRQGEIWDLTWDRVDLKAAVVSLRAGDTKTSRARRVPLTPRLVRVLRWRLTRRTGERVFKTKASSASDRFCDLRDRANLKDVRFHDLRHTAATRMVAQGVSLLHLKKIGGWTKWSTLERYTHVSPEDVAAATAPPIRRA